MALVSFLLFALLAAHAFAALPSRLAATVNVLLYMALTVLSSNLFTLMNAELKLFADHPEPYSAFSANEWYRVPAVIAIGAVAIQVLPKRFTPTQTLFQLLIGVLFGLLFDNTLALPPFDLYDVGDTPGYQAFDLLTYVMYAAFGYLFIYFLEQWKLRGFAVIPYIAAWTAPAIGLERGIPPPPRQPSRPLAPAPPAVRLARSPPLRQPTAPPTPASRSRCRSRTA